MVTRVANGFEPGPALRWVICMQQHAPVVTPTDVDYKVSASRHLRRNDSSFAASIPALSSPAERSA